MSKKSEIQKYIELNKNIDINCLELISMFLPSEVIYCGESNKNHHFRLIIVKTDSGLCLSYNHFFVDDDNEENCGFTDIWINPFESYKSCNYLTKFNIEPPNNKEATKAIVDIYNFLIEKNILK